MKMLYEGKTKDVYELPDGNCLLVFKDDATGTDGVFDPGANTVGLRIDGIGALNLRTSVYFFEELHNRGFATHYLSADIEAASMTVRKAHVLGKGLEVICRYRAVGSFIRRYGAYIEEGALLPAYVEITLKDDARGDPLITGEALEALGILDSPSYEQLKGLTQGICQVIKDLLKEKGLELYDIKLEFGRAENGEIMLIDEIASGSMRVFSDGVIVEPTALTERILGD